MWYARILFDITTKLVPISIVFHWSHEKQNLFRIISMVYECYFLCTRVDYRFIYHTQSNIHISCLPPSFTSVFFPQWVITEIYICQWYHMFTSGIRSVTSVLGPNPQTSINPLTVLTFIFLGFSKSNVLRIFNKRKSARNI